MNSKPIIKSYVYFKDDVFFVSTIERDSSAAMNPPPSRYCETMAWLCDSETMGRINMVAHIGEGHGMAQHYGVCSELAAYGRYEEEQ